MEPEYWPLEENSTSLEKAQSPLPDNIRQQLRNKVALSLDKALDVIQDALIGKRVTKNQMLACKYMITFAPKLEHGVAPLTLVMNGIPRPQAANKPITVEAEPVQPDVSPSPAMSGQGSK